MHHIVPIAFLIIFLALTIYLILQPRFETLSHWHHTFDKLQFSSQEFYQSVEEGTRERQIPSLDFKRTAYQEVFIFGRSRDYLRIERGIYVFDICAAPFGTGFYVSWWFSQKTTFFRRVITKIPIVRWFLSIKTFRQIDTEIVFRELVHLGVLEAIDTMTNTQGARALTESERTIQSSKLITI